MSSLPCHSLAPKPSSFPGIPAQLCGTAWWWKRLRLVRGACGAGEGRAGPLTSMGVLSSCHCHPFLESYLSKPVLHLRPRLSFDGSAIGRRVSYGPLLLWHTGFTWTAWNPAQVGRWVDGGLQVGKGMKQRRGWRDRTPTHFARQF